MSSVRPRIRTFSRTAYLSLVVAAVNSYTQDKVVWSKQEQPIKQQVEELRSVPEDTRAQNIRALASEIRKLPPSANKVELASWLVSLCTEGDFGYDARQEPATTLSDALQETPLPDARGKIAYPYRGLAQLVRYEHVHVTLNDPKFKQAIELLEARDQNRQRTDFVLNDLEGKSWSLAGLHGKVVLVNFWATWCEPCRREIPDLNSLYQQFRNQGLVILGISDEDSQKVTAFKVQNPIIYPVLLDPDRKVNQQLAVEGVPKAFYTIARVNWSPRRSTCERLTSSLRCWRKPD
jgi:peroxiredoxin